MFNGMTLNGSVPYSQTSFLLSKLFPGHLIPNTNYTVNIYAVNAVSAGPPSITGASPTPTPGTYVFTYMIMYT